MRYLVGALARVGAVLRLVVTRRSVLTLVQVAVVDDVTVLSPAVTAVLTIGVCGKKRNKNSKKIGEVRMRYINSMTHLMFSK